MITGFRRRSASPGSWKSTPTESRIFRDPEKIPQTTDELVLNANILFQHFLRTLRNVRTYGLGPATSFLPVSLCLILMGIFMALLWSAQNLVPQWIVDTRIVAYLHSDTPVGDQEKLASELSGWQVVEDVKTVSREEAWERLKLQLGEWRDILEGMEDNNPLPPSLEITFKAQGASPGNLKPLLDRIRAFPQVEEVYYGKIWQEKLESFVRMIRMIGLGFVATLGLITALVICNTIKLAVFARREELEIYRIVGATSGFIRAPLYMEGALHGLLSAMMAVGVLYGLSLLGREVLPVPVAASFSWNFSDNALFALQLLGSGAGFGGMGAWLALRRF